MSTRLFEDDVVFLQRLLKSAGFYTDRIDGDWGANTDRAVNAFEVKFVEIAGIFGIFDARTERCIRTLHPKAQELARRSLKVIREAGINARIISGTRTYAEQNVLFKQGRFGNPGKIVTNARGGQSNHNFGIGWDVGIFTAAGAYLEESPLYKKAGQTALAAGLDKLEWGGNWTSIVDQPHYQHATGMLVSKVREKFELGKPYI
ncbi:MAG TPA: M15 family metallopeptidase [Pyrinomonadaceae bacterium]|jgi:peptidoglycan L-alanyl-D-glutamate endopeptidase CwlK